MPSFIGTPGGVNLYDEDAVVNGISGWTGPLTPEQIARLPWNAGVQPAGAALDLPGRQVGMDFEESTGVPLNALRDKVALAGSTLDGLRGEVPQPIIDKWKNDAGQNMAQAVRVIQAGANPKETLDMLIAPLLAQADQISAEYKNRQSVEKPTYRSVAGGGIIRITPAGKVEEVYASKPRPEPKTVSVTTKSGDESITRRFTEPEAIAYQNDKIAETEVKPLLEEYAKLKSKVGANDLSFGPDWLGLTDRKRALDELVTKIRQAGFDPDTGQRVAMASPVISGVTTNRIGSPLKIGRFTVIPQ